jgi:hypothetical protein
MQLLRKVIGINAPYAKYSPFRGRKPVPGHVCPQRLRCFLNKGVRTGETVKLVM